VQKLLGLVGDTSASAGLLGLFSGGAHYLKPLLPSVSAFQFEVSPPVDADNKRARWQIQTEPDGAWGAVQPAVVLVDGNGKERLVQYGIWRSPDDLPHAGLWHALNRL